MRRHRVRDAYGRRYRAPHADGPAPQVIVGVLLMLLGLALTLERLNIIEPVRMTQFWPVLPIVGGAAKLLQRSDANGRFWGGFWMVLGACLLANSLGIARVSVFGVAGPVLLILLGLAVMTRTFGGDQQAVPPQWPGPPVPPSPGAVPTSDAVPPGDAAPASGAAAAADDVPPIVPPPLPGADAGAGDWVTLFAFMANTTRTSTDRFFRGGEMGAILGQGRLDLRQAAIPPGATAVVDLFAMMAGHEIYVPPGWDVVSDAVLILAKVQDSRLPPIERLPPNAPRLRLRGFAMIGEIVIRN